MALTKEDLLAIRAMMKEELDPIKGDVSNIKDDISNMKQDISQIKEDTALIRDVVHGLSEWVEVASDVLKVKYPVK